MSKSNSKEIAVKICCISSPEEAYIAIDHGADAIGLVTEMPSGPGVIRESAISDILQRVPPGIDTFLLTSRRSVSGIIEQHRRLPTSTIQLVDTLETGTHGDLKSELDGVRLVQVVHVTDEKSIGRALTYSEQADALLLDSGNPDLKTKELGGTGRTHNWDISKRIIEAVQVPVYLAGGLNPGNVAQAINHVSPYGVDVCSGLRTNGALDPEKVRSFFHQIEKNIQ